MHNHLGVSSLIIGVGLLLPGLCRAGQAVAQPHSARTQTEDLFKRSGITKINPGNRAADFTLGEVNGHAVSLTSHRGNLVFLNFWATWCGPCRQEMPSMTRLYREFAGQGLSMLAVNEKERADQVASFMREYGLTFPVLLDFDGRVSSLYRVWGLPVTYIIDEEGWLVGMKSGARDWATREVLALFRTLLENRGSSRAVAGFMEPDPVEPLPGFLRVKSKGTTVHAQQETQSELIIRLEPGEELTPLGKTASGEPWYMIRTKAGAVGWIKASDVDAKMKTK